MPYLGAHMSIAGGLYKAIERIEEVGGEALQIFSKNQRQWKTPVLTEKDIFLFKKRWEKWGEYIIAIHTSYLINLATKNKDLQKKSINNISCEIKRASMLSIPYIITHPGSHGGDGVNMGLKRVITSIDHVLEQTGDLDVLMLFETTSGQGTSLGGRFEELAEIIFSSKYSEKLGICVDTAHIFEAGYNIRTKDGYEKTIEELIKTIGIEKLYFFHLNDSKTDLGSRIDRHEHIGKGKIGLNGFRFLLNDPRFKDHPMVLETPKGKKLKEDKMNLQVLRGLIH